MGSLRLCCAFARGDVGGRGGGAFRRGGCGGRGFTVCIGPDAFHYKRHTRSRTALKKEGGRVAPPPARRRGEVSGGGSSSIMGQVVE